MTRPSANGENSASSPHTARTASRVRRCGPLKLPTPLGWAARRLLGLAKSLGRGQFGC